MSPRLVPVTTPSARRRFKRTPLRLALLVLVPLALLALAALVIAQRWTPSRDRYPDQGVTIDAASGAVSWPGLAAAGVNFAYLRATTGAGGFDPAFEAHLAAAREAGIRHGVIHRYDPCVGPATQATRFLATVPRDNAMLPPVVEIAEPACPAPPARGALLAALNTFLNQIEAHAGKPAILRLPAAIEARYDLSSSLNRTLWLEGPIFPPDYATRPWVMWTASTWKRVSGIEGRIEWDVVRP